jgi:putative peptidoglycan lipid II flippase
MDAAAIPVGWRDPWRRCVRALATPGGAVALLSAIAICSKGVGFARSVVLAARFGTSHAVAAFVVVSGLQAVIAIVLADAVGIGVATLVARNEATPRAALGFATGLACLTAVAQVAASGLVAGPLTSHQADLAGEVQRALVWTAAGSGGVVLMGGVGGVLIAQQRLQLSGWLPALAGLGTLLALVSIASPDFAIYGGWSLAMAGVPLVATIAIAGGPWKLIRSIRLNPRYLAVAAPVALATFASQGSFLVERRFAAPLGARAVASIGYAQQIAAVPLGILIGSLGTWALHAFLVRAKEGRVALRHSYYRTMFVTILSTAAMLLVFELFADQIVTLLLRRDHFSAGDARSAASALRGFALGLPAMGGYLVCLRAAQAQRRYVLIIAAAAMGLIVTVATVGRFTSAWDEFGVLLATSVGNWVSFVFIAGGLGWSLSRGEDLNAQ